MAVRTARWNRKLFQVAHRLFTLTAVLHHDFGFNENGERVGIAEFDYDQVEQDLGGYFPRKEQFTAKEIDAAVKVIDRVLIWVWQNGMRNPEGIKIRAIVVCWILLKPLRPFSLTMISQLYGKKKQSLGRWVDQFKRDFKFITPHMRPAQRPSGCRRAQHLLKALHGAEGLRRSAQVCRVASWPPEIRDQVRETLAPVVAELWPEW
jgi:hypothetical protein